MNPTCGVFVSRWNPFLTYSGRPGFRPAGEITPRYVIAVRSGAERKDKRLPARVVDCFCNIEVGAELKLARAGVVRPRCWFYSDGGISHGALEFLLHDVWKLVLHYLSVVQVPQEHRRTIARKWHIAKSIIIEPAFRTNRPCGGRSNGSMVVLAAVE